MDTQAKADYTFRLTEFREALQEADAANDVGREARVRTEIEILSGAALERRPLDALVHGFVEWDARDEHVDAHAMPPQLEVAAGARALNRLIALYRESAAL